MMWRNSQKTGSRRDERRRFESSRAGFTMPELLGTLMIVTVLIGIGYKVYASAMSETRQQEFTQNAVQFASALQTRFKGQGDYAGLTDAVAISAQCVPDGWVSGTSLATAWGSISLSTASSDTEAVITFSDVPEGPTNALANMNEVAWDAISINGTDIDGSGNLVATVAGAISNSNTIVLTVPR